MGQHAEGVALAAGEDRFGIDEGGAGLGQLRAVDTARWRPCRRPPPLPASAPAPVCSLGMCLARPEPSPAPAKRDALGAVDRPPRADRRSEIGDEGGDLPAQGHRGSSLKTGHCERSGNNLTAARAHHGWGLLHRSAPRNDNQVRSGSRLCRRDCRLRHGPVRRSSSARREDSVDDRPDFPSLKRAASDRR